MNSAHYLNYYYDDNQRDKRFFLEDLVKILITNDDGVSTPGITILANIIRHIADVDVVAPDRDQSASSHSLTLMRPLRVKRLKDGHLSVDGTPTDCIHMAIRGLLKHRPDMVISGINDGGNLGDDVLYSGTVAAALEGRFLGASAIAVSLMAGEARHYETAAVVAKNLVLQLIRDPLPKETILNVNVPNLPLSELEGFEVTRLGSRKLADGLDIQQDPHGRTIYWIGPAGSAQDSSQGTDFFAISHNRVSITPLEVDLTHYRSFEQLASWVKSIDVK